MRALRFAPYEDALPLLEACGDLGIRTAVVSDWDCALATHLDEIGIGHLVDAVVTSAEVGIAKPDPRIFAAALAAVDVSPAAALHLGDDPRRDLAGPRRRESPPSCSIGIDRHADISPRVETLTAVIGLL